jgi:hypothetical protein
LHLNATNVVTLATPPRLSNSPTQQDEILWLMCNYAFVLKSVILAWTFLVTTPQALRNETASLGRHGTCRSLTETATLLVAFATVCFYAQVAKSGRDILLCNPKIIAALGPTPF